MSYAFRIPFEFVQNGLGVEEPTLTLWEEQHGERVWLEATGPLESAVRAHLRGGEYPTAAEAEAAGARWFGVLILALTRGRIDVDFLERRTFASWSSDALDVMQQAVSEEFVVVNERSGIIVHDAEVEPISIGFSATGKARQPAGYFLEQFERSVDATLRSRTTLAYGLFAARGRLPNDAQLLTMVSAIEALVDTRRLDDAEQTVIDELVRVVRDSDIPPERRDALRDRVAQLRRESVGSGARRLIASLGEREYDGMPAKRFFARVYDLRSNMTHGEGSPSLADVGNVLSPLIDLTRDLIEASIVQPDED